MEECKYRSFTVTFRRTRKSNVAIQDITRAIRTRLRERNSKALELHHLDGKTLVPVFGGSGFRTEFSTSSRLSRIGISRDIMASDSRGRIVLAESSSLVFLSPLTATNVRHSKRSHEAFLPRHSLCILGTSSLTFEVIGLKLGSNERHLVVWGTSEVQYLILKPGFDGVEETIRLIYDLEDGRHILKCEWLPGSEGKVAVSCKRYVRIYDIGIGRFEKSSSTNSVVRPVIGYNLGFEANSFLRDISIASPKVENASLFSSKKRHPDYVTKLFLLLENGRLHCLDVKIRDGKIESPSELHIEPKECVSFATAGIRARSTSSVYPAGATARSLGEGSQLAYLKLSRCVLYQCKSSAVVALMLNEDGTVEGSFEFLPHSISSALLGHSGFDVSGPYSQWTELGVVYLSNGMSAYRVACTAHSASGQQKLLCIEFNEDYVKVKEIRLDSEEMGGLGVGFSSFEGLAAFSAPLIQSDSGTKMAGERTFLCGVNSKGNMLVLGDEEVGFLPLDKDGKGNVLALPMKLKSITTENPGSEDFPLTMFERLTNVSENDSLVFLGVERLGVSSEELKSMLSRDSSTSYTCPHEGCCFSISLRTSKNGLKDQVISAVRILVGSSPESTPSKFFVQGRKIEVLPNLKRWYNVPLTEIEILVGIRAGHVELRVGSSFDLNHRPVLEAIEVYASERDSVVIPRSYFAKIPQKLPVLVEDTKGIDEKESAGISLAVRAISRFFEVVNPSCEVPESGKDLLFNLIQETALHPDQDLKDDLKKLAEFVEQDEGERERESDDRVLIGCIRSLGVISKYIATATDDSFKKRRSIYTVFHDCLKVCTSIARNRPINYLQSMGNIVDNKLAAASVAVELTKICSNLKRTAVEYQKGDIVTLTLYELAINLLSDDTSKHSKAFPQFNNEYLDFSDECCHAVSTFFRTHYKSTDERPDLFAQLEAARLIVYQCDCCMVVPMKEFRYTILEKDYGIE